MTHAARIAAIDIGTNTVLLLVAERDPEGGLRAVEEHATITRLGQGVDKTRALHPDAVARTKACLDDYGAIVRRLQASQVAVVGTSAMRDAAGGEAIVEHVRAVFGVTPRVIAGDEEAELTFTGALVGLPAIAGPNQAGLPAAKGAVTVFDIGGGSTEIVQGAGGAVHFKKSFDVGSVRLTERHVRSDPPARGELDAIRDELRATFVKLPALDAGTVPIGIAGTVTTLAAISLNMAHYDAQRVHGHRLEAIELRRVVEHLASLPLEARKNVVGLEPKRADVIVAGGLIVLALLEHWNAPALVVSDRGVRWGLAVALARSAATL